MITFTLDYTGTADVDDVLAARHIVHLENQRRARLTPPGAPLPFANGAQIKSSYLSLLLAQLTAQHVSNTSLAKSITGISARFTDAERAQIFANLSARLNSGEAAATIVTDTAA